MTIKGNKVNNRTRTQRRTGTKGHVKLRLAKLRAEQKAARRAKREAS